MSALDRACGRLRRLVGQGRLVAGTPLIEADLAARLAVARGTVREALRRLESEGLFVARKRGLQVRRLARTDVVDLYETREVLEGLAARRAAQRMVDSNAPPPIPGARLAAERRIWTGVRGAFQLAAFSEQNRSFHDLIVAASGNAHLPRLLDQTLLALFASQFRSSLASASIHQAAAEHLLVLAAVVEGEGGRAEQAMRRHVRNSAATILALPDEAFA